MVASLPEASLRLRRASAADRGGSRRLAAHDRQPATIVLTRSSWPPRLTSPDACCSRSNMAPHGRFAAAAGYVGHRGRSGLRCRRKRRACASPAALALWFPQAFGGESEHSTRCWPAPSWIKSFPAASPQGAVLLRAFFGGHSGDALLGEADDQLIERARLQLGRVLGPLPQAVGNRGAPLASVAAAIRRRPPGPYGGVGIAAERHARSSSGGQRLLRSGIARSYPSGSSCRSTAARAVASTKCSLTATLAGAKRSPRNSIRWNRLTSAQ